MRTLLSVIAILFWSATASAVEPTIRSLNIRGLRVWDTTEIICDGDDLTSAPRLLLPFPAEQELKPGSTDKRAIFAVTLPAGVEHGYYQLRVATAGGVSLPVVIGVDSHEMVQQEFKTPIEKLPVALHGSVSGSSVMETKFTGKRGEWVTIEIEAQRLGSKLRPVIHLYDSKGKQLGWGWPQPALFGDARMEFSKFGLPEDGEYRVTVHDLEYAAPSPNFFRLRIGRWTRLENIFPPVIASGEEVSLEYDFYFPGGYAREKITATPGKSVTLVKTSDDDLSGPLPFLRNSNQRELRYPALAQELSLAEGPLGISGRLKEPHAEDRYKLVVKPGDKLRCEVFSQRYGGPLDTGLTIRNNDGAVLAQAEDSPGSLDPVLEYTVPEKVTSLQVCVTDSQGRGSRAGTYHLNLRNLNDKSSGGDFKLLTGFERTAVAKGGRWVVPFWIERRGYSGPIELSATGLPAGVSVTGNTIPAGSSGTLISLNADDTEPQQPVATTQWVGKTPDGKSQPVVIKNHPLEMLQPWLAEEIAVARVNSAATDFSIDWRDLPESAALQPTAKLALPIKITRIDDKSAVRLSLVSSQFVTLGNNSQPDPNKTLRVERAVELGAKMNEGEVTLLVPPDLADDAYDLAVQAELLSADKQKVVATSFTPVRRLPVSMPVEVELAGEPKIDVMLDPAKGAMQKIEGTVKRREGITGDVTIALAGLPAGARADSPVVKADASSFSVNVVLPANQPAGEIAGLKLSATIAPDPKQANARVKSREVEIKLNVVRP